MEKKKGRPPSDKGQTKDLRIALSIDAYSRVKAQALRLDTTPAAFSRQVIMERVSVLEAHESQGGATDILKQIVAMGKEMEQEIMDKKTL